MTDPRLNEASAAQPQAIEQLLADAVRRLGRLERDMIDLKTHLKVPRRDQAQSSKGSTHEF